MTSQLEQLKKITTVVADTGDFQSIIQYQPTDATTNPSLLLQAASLAQYQSLVDDAIAFALSVELPYGTNGNELDQRVEAAIDKLYVNFGREILKVVKGRVSTEIDARLSFDTEATIKKGKQIIAMYEKEGISRDRILVKIATTWEGIQAAKFLEEQEKIHCNMTLLFSKIQAIACAQVAHATLISPFVGRILDWYKLHDSKEKQELYLKDASQDPGVLSVKDIYNYFKKFDLKTVIMGASFRNKNEIVELAGIDLLTISPALLAELDSSVEAISQKLSPEIAKKSDVQKIDHVSEAHFRWELNESAMATEKLAEGIRKFAADQKKLETVIANKISEKLKSP